MLPKSELRAIEEFVAEFGTSVAGDAGPPYPAAQPDSDSRGPHSSYEWNAPSGTAPTQRQERATTNPQNSRDHRQPLLL